MKAAEEVKARLAFITETLIQARLAQPPTAEEREWIADMAEIQKLFAFEKPGDEREYRRLYWEWKLGAADWIDEPLEREDFVSDAAYRQCL